MLALRPYQENCLSDSLAGFEQFRRQLVIVPTGGGKAILMAKMAEAMLPKKTLMLCHREELIFQAADKLKRATGLFAQIEKAEHRASSQSDIVVASVQTMQGPRLARWPQDHFGLVIADEAHHSISPSWQSTLNYFDKHAKVWACTATPDRGDKKNLGQYYENIAFEISLFDLINQGYLSRIAVKSVPIKIDLNGVHVSAGDFKDSELSDALLPYLRSIAVAIREEAAFRRTLVFVPLVATSKKFVEIMKEEGLNAAHIDGESPDRKEILARFAYGEFDVLSNAMLLTEGYDDPGIDCICILRPTKSRSLYSQMVGRGTRIAPGKRELMLLDPLWLHESHNLIRPAHLVASNELQADIISELVEKKTGGESQELLDLEGLATEAQALREQKLREQLSDKSTRKTKQVDAMEWCLLMGAAELADYEPVMKWEGEALTGKQAETLMEAGIDLNTVHGKGHASQLIDVYMNSEREKRAVENAKPASPGQKKIMRRMRHPNWHSATVEDAKRFFVELNQRRKAA
jgi:superfamily II DNA or RNA helicase